MGGGCFMTLLVSYSIVLIFFFFSSRRRHTRSLCDWSSDVCSSDLTKGNQWSFFPSGAVSWRISQEEFLRNSKSISDLKLRLSYGLSGNQAVASLQDRKSTRLNSSHTVISYAVFCLKKKKKKNKKKS